MNLETLSHTYIILNVLNYSRSICGLQDFKIISVQLSQVNVVLAKKYGKIQNEYGHRDIQYFKGCMALTI